MERVIYSTETDQEGPWLISQAKLLELDSILALERKRALKFNETAIEKEADSVSWIDTDLSDEQRRKKQLDCARRRYPYNVNRLQITLLCRSGKSFEVDSFKEAARSPSVSEEEVVGFTVGFKWGEIDGSLRLRRSAALSLSVSPEGPVVSRDAFFALREWVESLKPARWMKAWLSLSNLQWPVWFLFLVIAAVTSFEKVKAGNWAYQDRAKSLVGKKLTSAEQEEALRVLIALQTEHEKPRDTYRFRAINPISSAFAAFTVVCIVLSFPPRVVLEIGKNKAHYQRWRWWTKTIFVTIPIILFSSFVWPKIVIVLETAFSS